MPFEAPLTVRDAVENINRRKWLLPAIQRELVWSTSQMEALFDSLMRDYPIGSFLFWHVEREKSTSYQFYEFIREYHERYTRHNPKADVRGDSDITAILDGQQRLTALYIGLKGKYAHRLPRKRWDNDSSYPDRELYLNLLARATNSDSTDMEYDFRFLTKEEAAENNDDYFWFRVGKILDMEKEFEVNNFLIDNGLLKHESGKARFANETLFKLHSVIHKNLVINYYLEKGEKLDKVLNIFIRVNSGGTPLSYSDLLLSIATAQWQKRDAREEITKFVDEINRIGSGFNVNKDFVLKSCLVLSDFSDIAFKVDNFNKSNMLKIEDNWSNISEAIKTAVKLVSGFGYNRDTLTSNYALIPISYYLLIKGLPSSFLESSANNDDRMVLQKWLILSLLRRAFSGQPDSVLGPIRQILKADNSSFPLEKIVGRFRGGPKSIAFDQDDLENLFLYEYGESYTFSTLAILYPTFDFKNKFHIDHIHPRSFFLKRNLVEQGIPGDKHNAFFSNFDRLANLQLLEGTQNEEKSNTDFKEWLTQRFPSEDDQKSFRDRHCIPSIDLSFTNFEEFIKERERLLMDKFKALVDTRNGLT